MHKVTGCTASAVPPIRVMGRPRKEREPRAISKGPHSLRSSRNRSQGKWKILELEVPGASPKGR